jgi:hypothetical protein
MLLKAAILHRLTPVCWQPTARKASGLPVLRRTPFYRPPTTPKAIQLACFAPNSPLYIDHLQPPKQSNLPVLGRTYPNMSGGQNYLLLAMDMAKVGGVLSVVKVSTSMLCVRIWYR